MPNPVRTLLHKLIASDKSTPVATSNPLASAFDLEIDLAARKYIQKSNTVGLSIGILQAGNISTYHYGETARGSAQLPNADSIFEIGSITKTFTAVLLAYFVNEGLVSLSDPITRYLPADVAANRRLKNIQLVHLANHTSGLPRLPLNVFLYSSPRNPYKNYTPKRLFAALKTCRLKSAPGEVYSYSNLGFGLLGAILEQVSGKSYEQLVQEIITGPLNMHSTGQHLSAELNARLLKGYNSWGRPAKHWDFDALAGCGALRSSLNDLLFYAKANMTVEEGVLSKALDLSHRLTFPKNPRVALGWHILTADCVDHYWHNGGTFGSRSFLLFNAEKNLAIVVLSNAAVSCDALAINILKVLK